jgi:cytosine deaminase
MTANGAGSSAFDGSAYWLTNATVPAVCLSGLPAGAERLPDGLVRVDIAVANGKVADVRKTGDVPDGVPGHDLDGGMVWPSFVELHTHLDKGHIWPRTRNPDGTFMGAFDSVRGDRSASWNPDDVRRRMEFSLQCAYAHGTKAIRTHIDSFPPQDGISWPVVTEMRRRWAGKIELQPVNLVPLPYFADAEAGKKMADRVADGGGVLGAVSYIEENHAALLDRIFTLAAERGLDLDFHVDEGLDPAATSLREISLAAARHKFRGRVNCGHCCAFSIQDENYVETVLGLVADAGLSVVSLPMCNMYLQDRTPGRTPRNRGVTLLQEFHSRGVPVSISSDNTRDPFYGFGDLDMIEVFTQATRIAHLDTVYDPWPAAIGATPAGVMGLEDAGRIAAGATADLVLLRGRNYSEMLSRPQSDRIVLRAGKPIDTTPPDYRELDPLFAVAS